MFIKLCLLCLSNFAYLKLTLSLPIFPCLKLLAIYNYLDTFILFTNYLIQQEIVFFILDRWTAKLKIFLSLICEDINIIFENNECIERKIQ
jgi:hypothetical protein